MSIIDNALALISNAAPESIDGFSNVHLVLDVTYMLNGEDPSTMASNLEKMVLHAIGECLLTGHTEAEVETHSYEATCLVPDEIALTEGQICDWIDQRIGEGDLAIKDIPRLMARYALADPAKMRKEILERIVHSD